MTSSERAVENLLYVYAERIDRGDFEGVADLFAHGRIRADPDSDDAVEGRDAVLALYEATTRRYPDDGTPHTKHVVTNPIVEVDHEGASASARSNFVVLQAAEGIPLQPIITGRYRDTFHMVDGAWWFDTRTMVLDQFGDLSRHLLIDLS